MPRSSRRSRRESDESCSYLSKLDLCSSAKLFAIFAIIIYVLFFTQCPDANKAGGEDKADKFCFCGIYTFLVKTACNVLDFFIFIIQTAIDGLEQVKSLLITMTGGTVNKSTQKEEIKTNQQYPVDRCKFPEIITLKELDFIIAVVMDKLKEYLNMSIEAIKIAREKFESLRKGVRQIRRQCCLSKLCSPKIFFVTIFIAITLAAPIDLGENNCWFCRPYKIVIKVVSIVIDVTIQLIQILLNILNATKNRLEVLLQSAISKCTLCSKSINVKSLEEVTPLTLGSGDIGAVEMKPEPKPVPEPSATPDPITVTESTLSEPQWDLEPEPVSEPILEPEPEHETEEVEEAMSMPELAKVIQSKRASIREEVSEILEPTEGAIKSSDIQPIESYEQSEIRVPLKRVSEPHLSVKSETQPRSSIKSGVNLRSSLKVDSTLSASYKKDSTPRASYQKDMTPKTSRAKSSLEVKSRIDDVGRSVRTLESQVIPENVGDEEREEPFDLQKGFLSKPVEYDGESICSKYNEISSAKCKCLVRKEARLQRMMDGENYKSYISQIDNEDNPETEYIRRSSDMKQKDVQQGSKHSITISIDRAYKSTPSKLLHIDDTDQVYKKLSSKITRETLTEGTDSADDDEKPESAILSTTSRKYERTRSDIHSRSAKSATPSKGSTGSARRVSAVNEKSASRIPSDVTLRSSKRTVTSLSKESRPIITSSLKHESVSSSRHPSADLSRARASSAQRANSLLCCEGKHSSSCCKIQQAGSSFVSQSNILEPRLRKPSVLKENLGIQSAGKKKGSVRKRNKGTHGKHNEFEEEHKSPHVKASKKEQKRQQCFCGDGSKCDAACKVKRGR